MKSLTNLSCTNLFIVNNKHHHHQRHGVVLLIVLSLLALFSLIAITFVLSSHEFFRSSVSLSKVEMNFDDPKDVLDRALTQLLVDTPNRDSAMHTHGLLTDMYGHLGMQGTITKIEELAQGQILQLTLDRNPEEYVGFAGGCVITMQSGPANGFSTHIVFQDITDPRIVRVRAFVGDATDASSNKNLVLPQAGDRFYINGHAFAGTGFGYNPTTFKLDLQAGGEPLVLFPNHTKSAVGSALSESQILAGGANEEYDAVDSQNMALAMMLPTGKAGKVIPSFHRPALINFHKNHDDLTGDPSALRKIVLRPTRFDHPSFSGGNPALDANERKISNEQYIENLINGPFDVDNDGDKTPDSVWLDLGFPVQTAPDGRRYKILIAPLVVPLDGALNVNTAGSLDSVKSHYQSPVKGVFAGKEGEVATADIHRGRGEDVAAINPAYVLGPSVAQKIMEGDADHEGRYGRDKLPGTGNEQDLLSKVKFYDRPENWLKAVLTPTSSTAFASPPDLREVVAVASDPLGRPVWSRSGEDPKTPDLVTNFLIDSPYDSDISQSATRGSRPKGGRDNLFTPAEFERILRRWDSDVYALPTRLVKLAPELNNYAHRFEITTESFHVPVPFIQTPFDLRQSFKQESLGARLPKKDKNQPFLPSTNFAGRAQSIVDLMRMRIRKEKGDETKLLKMYLPPEVFAGLPYNVNRQIGNARDDNGNDLIDEPIETARPQMMFKEDLKIFGNAELNLSADDEYFKTNVGSLFIPGNVPRLIYARHMYVMMMSLIPNGTFVDFTGDGVSSQKETAKGIAQWAINVVEFMDRDSIMTKFHYDDTPFNGWEPLNSLKGRRQFVWGCERPELIITEAIAGHNRNTEDLEEPRGKTTAEGANKDPHFDQRLRPEGWVYVELYNPWTDKEGQPGEFYNKNSTHKGIDLTTRSPDAQPVWRLLYHISDDYRDDIFNPRLEGPTVKSSYFIDSRVRHPADGSRNGWDQFRSNANPVAPIRGGHYAVVGSRRQQVISRVVGQAGDGSTVAGVRRIELRPNRDPNQSYIRIHNNIEGEVNSVGHRDEVRPVVAIVIDQAPGGQYAFSLTTPSKGYDNTVRWTDINRKRITSTFSRNSANGEGAYSPPIDLPIDRSRGFQFDYLNHTQTITRFRVVHLQRLADPTANFHSTDNPFLTLDTFPMDLTIYNGAERGDPYDKKKTVMFESHERGEAAAKKSDQALIKRKDLWSQEDVSKKKTVIATLATDTNFVFPYQLNHTLGYLNHSFSRVQGGPEQRITQATDPLFKGAPKGRTFPWLTWLNRPYLNPMELMLVPKAPSQFLLRQYSMPPEAVAGAAISRNVYSSNRSNFNHLLNFFYTKKVGGAVAGDPTGPPQLHRIFGLMASPSKFIGAETYGNPREFQNLVGNKPPFNVMSHYREPGKININMIYSPNVWKAVANGYKPFMTEQFWNDLVSSRRGYSGGGTDLMAMNSEFPSRFNNPFRSFGGSDFSFYNTKNAAEVGEINSTLLRARLGTTGKPTNLPLFAFTKKSGFVKEYNDPERSPFYRYEGIMRLNNLVTTRSNVYAIWLTMGYFEVTENSEAPGGFELGAEIGSDTNEIVRHRGFYMFDRSIPVACQPGRLNNILKAVYIQRFIE